MQHLTHLYETAVNHPQTAADCILERLYAEQRLARLNHTFLQFTANALDNINRLTACCGELLQADCALYNRLANNRLTVIGSWNAPPDLPREDSATGHICCDVIHDTTNSLWQLNNLQQSNYATTDQNVARYGLQSYFGKAVSLDQKNIGSLCVVYCTDVTPTCQDVSILNIIATAIAVEEERYRSEQERLWALTLTTATLEATKEGILVVSFHPETSSLTI